MSRKPKSNRRPHPPAGNRTSPVAPVRRPGVSPELWESAQQIVRLVEEDPEGWSRIAEVIRNNEEIEPADLVQCLSEVLGKKAFPLLQGLAADDDDELAEAAIASLVKNGTRAAGEALVETHARVVGTPREVLVWRGVEALSARGINVKLPEPEGARAPQSKFQIRSAWSTPGDGVGTREVVVRGQDPYGVWRSLMLVWNEIAGVKDGFLVPMSRQDWERIVSLQAREGAELIAVPLEYAQWEVSQARKLNEKSGFALKDHLDAWDELVGPPPDDYVPPSGRDLLADVSDEEREELLKHLHCLLHLSVFKSWGVEPADLQPYFAEFQALDELEGEEQDARAVELYTRAANAVIVPELKERLVARLLEAAVKFHMGQQPHAAQLAAIVAVDLEAREPGETEFGQWLIDFSLNHLAEILEDGEDPESLRYDPMSEVEDVGQHEVA